MARRPSTLPPILSPVALPELRAGDPSGLRPHESYDGLDFPAADLRGLDLAGISFLECSFTELSAGETDLRSASFVDTRFERLDAPILSAPRSRFRDVSVTASRWGSAELYDAEWQSVHLVDCRLGYVNLRGATLHDVLFTNCTIDELDLGGATAHRTAFVDTRIDSLDVTGATLTHTDLRGADLRRLTGLEGLKGATLTALQVAELAPLFASHLGLRVEE